MDGKAADRASFETQDPGRCVVRGLLVFDTVAYLLPRGSAAIAGGRAAVIDLAGVTGSDSSGLALLIEWLSVARDARRALTYENMPTQLHQLAALSEVDGLVSPAPGNLYGGAAGTGAGGTAGAGGTG
jgi:phospholipid transport system transporter-binding protein